MSSTEPKPRPRNSKLLKFVIAFLIIAPLVTIGLFVAGILTVTPVRRVGSMPTPVVVVEGIDGSVTLIEGAPPLTPKSGGGSAAISMQPTPSSRDSGETKEPAKSFLTPDDGRIVFAAFGIAALAVSAGAAVISLIGRRWESRSGRAARRASRVRYGITALVLWLVFGAFLLADLSYAVSVYWRVLLVFAGLVLLLATVMVLGRPMREKALVIGCALLLVLSVPLATWNSRKAFLRSLYSVRHGMTLDQVEAIMSEYMGGDVGPAVAEGIEVKSYRHTTEGWGDSDFGVVSFEDGRVVEVSFLPD